MVILIWTFAFCLCSSVPLTMYTSLSDFRITVAPVWLLILLRLLPSLPITKPLYLSGISTSSPAKDCSWILFFIFSCRRKKGCHAKRVFPLRHKSGGVGHGPRDQFCPITSLQMAGWFFHLCAGSLFDFLRFSPFIKWFTTIFFGKVWVDRCSKPQFLKQYNVCLFSIDIVRCNSSCA